MPMIWPTCSLQFSRTPAKARETSTSRMKSRAPRPQVKSPAMRHPRGTDPAESLQYGLHRFDYASGGEAEVLEQLARGGRFTEGAHANDLSGASHILSP